MDARIALQQTRQHFRHLGLTLPAALEKELSEIDAAHSNNRIPVNPDPEFLVVAAWNALAAGRDVSTDKTVTAELMSGLLAQQNLGARLHQHADGLRAVALTRHAEEVLEAMTEVVTKADAALGNAHAVIPDLDIASAAAVTFIPPKHSAAWAHARDAATRLGSVGQVWIYVAQACGLARIPQGARERSLILVDVDLDELDALPINPHDPSPWTTAVVHSGHQLDYATPEEFAQRLRRIEEQRRERAAQREQEKRTQTRL